MKSRTAVPLTPDQVRQRLRQQGKTLTQWSLEHGYDRKAVYRVMSGADKAYYGKAHDIAVALGLKLPSNESSADNGDRNTQSRQAA